MLMQLLMYGTALVQCREYMHATYVVVAYGSRVYSCDTQFVSNLRVVSSHSYIACIVITHAKLHYV